MPWLCRTATSTTTSLRRARWWRLLNLGASVMNINIVKGDDAAVSPRRQRGRTPVHRLAAEGTGSQLRRCRVPEVGQEGRARSAKTRKQPDPAAGDRNHRAGNSRRRSISSVPARPRTHREDLPMAGGSSRKLPGLVENVTAGVLDAGGVVQRPLSSALCADRWTGWEPELVEQNPGQMAVAVEAGPEEL